MIDIVVANLSMPAHAKALIHLLNTYALDPMGGGQALADNVKENLSSTLNSRSDTHVILAFANDTPVGLLIAFDGFSTFACKPLLNIHDIVVAPEYRGRGIAKSLLERAEEIAMEKGCCKMTLEVLEGNTVAKGVYSKCGFNGYELDPKMGKALFWEKKLGR